MQNFKSIDQSVLERYPIVKKVHNNNNDNDDNNDDTYSGWIMVRNRKYFVADKKDTEMYEIQ